MREITPAMLAALRAPTVAPIMFLSLTTISGPCRMWTGLGIIEWDGVPWYGGGTLLGIDGIAETSEIEASGITLSLSGVGLDILRASESEMRPGQPVSLWLGALGDDGQLLSDPVLIWRGLSDVPSNSDDGSTCTISLTAESRLLDLERSRSRRYTDQDQQAVYPGDKGFAFVAALQDADFPWGQT